MGFFIVVIGIMTLMCGYIGARLILTTTLPSPWNVVAWSALAVLALLPPLAFFLRVNGQEFPWVDRFSMVGYIALGFLSLLFFNLFLRDVIWFFVLVIGKGTAFARTYFGDNPINAEILDPDRRQFLINAVNLGIVGLTGGMTGLGFYQARRTPEIVEVPLVVENLHPDLEGFRIVQLTDLHIGPTLKRKFVELVVRLANSLDADIIAVTGDLVDGSVTYLRDDIAPIEDLTAKFGTFFVTGNHEYYSGVAHWLREAERLGMTVLSNEHAVIERGEGKILLAGVNDFNGAQFGPSDGSNPAAAIDGAPDTDVKILLAHQPRSIFEASRAGFDIQISGHTHGGQYFPWKYLVALQQPFIKGLHRYENTAIYVSSGAGYWGPPLRLGIKSEITLLKLTAGNASRA